MDPSDAERLGIELSNVLQLSTLIGFVSAQVEKAMTGQIEEQYSFFTGLTGGARLLHHRSYSVSGFRRRYDTFALSEKCCVFKDFCLVISLRLDQAKFKRMTDHG